MPGEVQINILNLNKLIRKLSAASSTRVISQTLKTGATHITGWVKKNRLSGPRPRYLGVVSNRLRSSISRGEVERGPEGLFINIGTNVEYAAAHEFGSNKRIQIKSHVRRMSETVSFMSEATGRRKKKKRFAGYSHVKPHTRRSKIKERPFLRPAIESRTNQLFLIRELNRRLSAAFKRER